MAYASYVRSDHRSVVSVEIIIVKVVIFEEFIVIVVFFVQFIVIIFEIIFIVFQIIYKIIIVLKIVEIIVGIRIGKVFVEITLRGKIFFSFHSHISLQKTYDKSTIALLRKLICQVQPD